MEEAVRRTRCGEVRNLMQLHEDNTLLKQLVVDLSLDKAMLQDVLSKKF